MVATLHVTSTNSVETHDEGPSHTWVQWQTALPVEG